MKMNKITLAAIIASAAWFAGGCSKQEETAPQSSTEVQRTVESAPTTADRSVNAVRDAGKTTADVVKSVEQEASQTKAAVEKTVTDTAAQTADQVQNLIDSAKKLIAENKGAEALELLGKLSNVKLSSDQQQLVNSLKQQVEQALSKQATGEAQKAAEDAVGNPLKKN
jgi:hypothetical protein